jgi:uncharacterized cupredoxin-like copper-binding protein
VVGVIAAMGLAACGSSSKSGAATNAAATPSTSTGPARATPAAHAATATPPSGSTKVAVSLSEFKIKPTVHSATAGHVEFVVSNDGKLKHQFTIIRTNKSAATVLSKHNPNDDIAGARGEIPSIAPGATKKLVIKNLKPGHYAFVCALPGHYQSGMRVDFTVT